MVRFSRPNVVFWVPMNQELIFSDELKDSCVKQCRHRLLNLEELDYCSSDSSFGHLYSSSFHTKWPEKYADLYDSTDDRERGHVMVREYSWPSTRMYVAINLDGVAYEAFPVTAGPRKLWSAILYRQGERIGSINELPREEEQGWFRRIFTRQHKFEIAMANGEYFGKIEYQSQIIRRTVELEIVGAPRTVPVSVFTPVCGADRSIIGPEIDWFQLKLSKEICFVVAMWIRYQVFSADNDSFDVFD